MDTFETYLNLDFTGSIQDTLDKVNKAALKYFRDKETEGFPKVIATYPDVVLVQTERYNSIDPMTIENYSLSYTMDEKGEIKINDATKIDIVPTIVSKTEKVLDTKQESFVRMVADTNMDDKTAKNLAKVLLLKKLRK